VGRHSINSAEAGFFSSLLSEGASITKEAVSLDSETAEALGVATVSPSVLDEIENEAEKITQESNADDVEPKPEPETYNPSPVEFLQEKKPDPEKAKSVELDKYDGDDTPAESSDPSPPLPSRESHGKLFTDKRAHPLQLFDTLNMRYREDWAEWEPETLQWAIRRDFSPLGELSLNKIQALGVAGRTNVPWLDWDIFENAGLAWNDTIPIFGAFQAMTPMQIAFAVHILNSIRNEEFSHEVNSYIAAILDDHGFVYAPSEWFAGAQNILSRGSKVMGLHGQVEDAWGKIKNVPPETVEWDYSNSLDVHLMKMAVIKKYLEGRKLLRSKVPGVVMASTTTDTLVP